MSLAVRLLLCGGLLVSTAGHAETFYEKVTHEVFDMRLPVLRSLTAGDYDNDGWPDVFMTRWC